MSVPAAGRVVIVGASLAGLRTAEALRRAGFAGQLTLIGDEPHEPYDRPPLSKAVLSGWLGTDHVLLPRTCDLHAEWLLGVPATGLDLAAREVRLADGRAAGFDRVVLATGAAARPWPAAGAALRGVHLLRGRDDADRLRADLADLADASAPGGRVLVIGGGFTGSEVASSCRDLGLPVTVSQRGAAPLASALGEVVGSAIGARQRAHGTDLRVRTTVRRLEGEVSGRCAGPAVRRDRAGRAGRRGGHGLGAQCRVAARQRPGRGRARRVLRRGLPRAGRRGHGGGRRVRGRRRGPVAASPV